MIRERCMCFSSEKAPDSIADARRFEMLPGERLGPGKGVEDGAMGGSTVGNHRRPAHAEQRSASHLLVVDAPLHLLELGLHQQGSGGRHPAGLRSDRPWAIIAAPRTPSSGAPPTAS